MRAGTDRRTPIRTLLAGAADGAPVRVTGWVKTSRFSKNVSFVHLFDGSTPQTVQVILDVDQAEAFKTRLGIGAAVAITGTWKASPGGHQAFEVAAGAIEIVGDCDPSDYPIQRKATSLEHLRTLAHLRPRTNTFQSVFRVRNAASWHIHRFFQERGFMWVHTPIITASDAEGAGEMFEIVAGDPPFFGKRTFLTVSGQLAVENFAQAFTDVYTFGPTFRAENSHTPRHAAEFWMIEPEIAFANLDDVIALAEAFVKEVTLATIADCEGDFDFFDQRIEPGVKAAVIGAVEQPFHRVTWHEAQKILVGVQRDWEYPVGPGTSLQSEHERFLAEEYFKGPVFVTNYPADQKAFYMRLDDALTDGVATVSATDLLVPRIGEIIGGSQREERLDVLDDRIRAHGLEPEGYWWYRDLRRYGTTPHGGFGLGLERLLLWMTGMKNIRDVLPYPRTPGNAEF
ncbi:MAG: asparagine--tRNA ligase [Alphaproteobacteria bacterium]|nr:asparagine--tRNA ligase [Alphaproteobacteria bacterium]